MPTSEKPAVQKEKPAKPSGGTSLYDIVPTGDSGFDVVLPGLYDAKREAIVGTTKKHFDTREAAEAAAAESREGTKAFEGGHAWNSFVTVGRTGETAATIVDTTWAKQNLDTRKLEGVDYTLTRMEPVVNEIGRNLPSGAPDKDEQLRHILSYYIVKIDQPGGTGGHASAEDEKQHYLSRALELMTKQGAVGNLPEGFIGILGEEAKKLATEMDVSEIETLWKVAKLNKGLSMSAIVSAYLKDKQLSDYHVADLMVGDDDLQREIFEQIRSHKDFDRLVRESPKFRIRMREAVPQLFIDFAPDTKLEDAAELHALVERSNSLRQYARFVDPKRPSKGRIAALYSKAREELQKLNPQLYEERAAGMDDYQLIKEYDKITRAFKQK